LRRKKPNDTEREVKRIAHVLFDTSPTTTKQGRREHARLMRKIEKVQLNKNFSLASKWRKLREDFVEFLNSEISDLLENV